MGELSFFIEVLYFLRKVKSESNSEGLNCYYYVCNLQRDKPSNMVSSKVGRKEEPNMSNLTGTPHNKEKTIRVILGHFESTYIS